MVTLTPPESPVLIRPTFSCFFERAEYFLEALFNRDFFPPQQVIENVVSAQQEAPHISVKTLDKALKLKKLQKQIHASMLLQADLLNSINNLTVNR
jgi:hypothetical protein